MVSLKSTYYALLKTLYPVGGVWQHVQKHMIFSALGAAKKDDIILAGFSRVAASSPCGDHTETNAEHTAEQDNVSVQVPEQDVPMAKWKRRFP